MGGAGEDFCRVSVTEPSSNVEASREVGRRKFSVSSIDFSAIRSVCLIKVTSIQSKFSASFQPLLRV